MAGATRIASALSVTDAGVAGSSSAAAMTGATWLVSTWTPSTAGDIVKPDLVAMTAASSGWRYPRSAKAASSSSRRSASNPSNGGADTG